MENNALEIKDLKKIYHQKDGEIISIEDVSFNIKDQEYISIVGPSGCGKSTILGIIANLINKSDGTIKFKNEKPIIGYMLQKDALLEWKTVLDNCLLGLKIQKKINKETKEKVLNLLKNYGLEEFIYKFPNTLSGGMRQRVALIRTLAINPDILLLDEPFSSLDYQTRLTLSNDLYNIIKKEKKTVIMVTHDIAEAISMSDRIIVLSKRPAIIKNIYEIKLENKQNPIENRKDKNFVKYYDLIWKEIDNNV